MLLHLFKKLKDDFDLEVNKRIEEAKKIKKIEIKKII